MRITKALLLTALSLVFVAGVYVSDAPAQRRVYYTRPFVTRPYLWARPAWSSAYWGWNDPYSYDPYYREQRERYYKQKDVKDSAKKLRKDREKYVSDGVLTAKEEEKLAKRQRDYNKAVQKLNEFESDH
jgi:hypothetical protein